MLDLGWSELLIIGVVALVVVGPKDLPKMFRTIGQLSGKARGMAREFQRAMEAAADDAGVKDLTEAGRRLRETASGKGLRDAVGLDDMERSLRDVGNQASRAGSGARRAPKSSLPPPAGSAADMAQRNAAAAEAEAARLKRAERAAAARQQAADLRARRAAETAAPPAAQPPAERPPAAQPATAPPANGGDAAPGPAAQPD